MKGISAKKESKETILHTLTVDVTKLDEERTVLRTEIEVLETEKSKFMGEANTYNQTKSSL